MTNPNEAATSDQTFVYKIFLSEQFAQFETDGEFLGSEDDLHDGFIHLSFAHQVAGTIEKHFQTCGDLVVAEFSALDLGPNLRAEVSRGDQMFPHLYGKLSFEHCRRRVDPKVLGRT